MSSSFSAKMELAKDMKEEDKLYRYNGVLYPVIMSPVENLKAMERLEARADDVMLVAYPKCGFNWMVAVLRKILAAATGEKAESQIPPLMEFFGPEMQQAIHKAPSPRFLGTHMHPDNIPASFTTKKTKDLSEGVRRVSEFFGFSLSDPQIQAIAEESTFNAMKESSNDSHGQMGNVLFRKGEVGDWKNHFSPAQSQEMDTAFKKHLAGTTLGAKLKYDLYCK